MKIKMRTISTIISIIIGITALNTSFNFGETAKKEILKKIKELSPDIIYIKNKIKNINKKNSNSKEKEFVNPITSKDVQILKNHLKKSNYISPVLQMRFTILKPYLSGSREYTIIGSNKEIFDIFNIKFFKGRGFSDLEIKQNKNICVVSKDVFDNLYDIHSIIKLNEDVKYIKIYSTYFQIIGIIENSDKSPFYKTNSNLVYIPYNLFIRFFNHVDLPNFILCKINKSSITENVISKIETMLMLNRKYKLYEIFDQRDYISKRKNIAVTIEWLINSISLLILLVACISSANIMFMNVNERIQEIGLRMAIGASKLNIIKMFLIEGYFLFIIGGIIGILLSYYTTKWILTPLPSILPGYEGWQFSFKIISILKSSIIIFISALISSLFPALRAANLDPSIAIRHE